MSIVDTSRLSFLASGCVVLLCIPAILLSGQSTWSERPIHTVQLFMTLVCFVSSLVFCYHTRRTPLTFVRGLAFAAITLTSLWLLFIVFVFFALVRSGLSEI
jgi:riboflavin transporter FmnP